MTGFELMKAGAFYSQKGYSDFTVWAPFAQSIELKTVSSGNYLLPLQKIDRGYWTIRTDAVSPGDQYLYSIDGERERPDPASFFQPHGVHEASEIIDHNSFVWRDAAWKGISLAEMIMYEIHVGAFTEEGTFDAAINRLDDLKELGINAIEIMPVAQFPGERNWGYDGVYPFAVQGSYGGPDGLKRFVDACHRQGVAVILDVVYNHLGPEGNYLRDFGPYFTDRYKTPWGEAINFDGPFSNEVRNYFISNALYWFETYHMDALRLDAIHGIYDMSARHFLLELAQRVKDLSQRLGRKCSLIAESDLNDSRVARPEEKGGFGLDAIWCDDFHHSIHTLLTGEEGGYYMDFGKTGHIVKSLREGYVYSGEYSLFRKRNHGNSSADLPADSLIVFSQNHDQTGNRMKGERLSHLLSFEAQKLAAAITILSPYIPILFMGEEYGEKSPFLYFVNHSDLQLIEGVRKGRKKEFEAFLWDEDPPDPQSPDTFVKSKLQWEMRNEEDHKVLLDFYRELIQLRKSVCTFYKYDRGCLDISGDEEKKFVVMMGSDSKTRLVMLVNFNRDDTMVVMPAKGDWKKVLDSSDIRWNGPGAILPDRLENNEPLNMRSESYAIYSADARESH